MAEVFEKYLRTSEIVFKYAKGLRNIYGKEVHTFHEVIFFLGGDAEFVSDEGRYRLEPNTAVVIPKGTFHQLSLFGPEEDYHRMIFNFDAVSGLDDLLARAFEKVVFLQDEGISRSFTELGQLIEHPLTKTENDALLKAYLSQIAVRLLHAEPICGDEYRSLNPLTRKVIALIGQNLKEALTVRGIAERLHVSPSYLAHVFRADMFIPIHRYLLHMRLTRASRMIAAGMPATQAASECGFRDYSGFFRQYRKFFEISPSATASHSLPFPMRETE